MRIVILSLVATLISLVQISGQVADSLLSIDLPSVELSSNRLWQSPATVQQWDSSATERRQLNALADLLASESGVFVKSYGLGSLATTSFRGASSSQMKVLWNGLPLENPMLGLLDLSQLNTQYFEQIQLVEGGQSVGYGSGAIAGTIQLHSKAASNTNGFKIGAESGALGLRAFNGDGYFVSHNNKWSFQTKLSQLLADNNFRYYDPRQDRSVRQVHAKQFQRGFQQSIFYRPKDGEVFSLRLWGQEYEKEIPAAAAQRQSLSSQGDDFFRLSLHYDRESTQGHLQLRSGLFREMILYRDPESSIYAPSHFWKAILEGEYTLRLPNQYQLVAAWSNQWMEGENAAYGRPKQQLRISPFVSIGRQQRFLHWQLSARQLVTDGKLLAFVPALYLAYLPNYHWTLSARVSRDFRQPTLNDLYWYPGGNPDTRSEQGWSEELSVSYRPENNFKLTLTAYHRLLKDWIQWAPPVDGGGWSARNLTKVRSYGVQSKLNVVHRLNQLKLQTACSFNYVRSLNLVAIRLPDMRANEQLAYTPELTANVRIGLVSKAWSLNYSQHYVSERRSFKRIELPAYWPARLTATYAFKLGQGRLGLNVRVENCWNQEYRVIERFRMPGRYIQGGVSYSWEQPSQKR